MTHKKSSFWRFLFSLIPGAGEMYMGFLKMGTSLMALFILLIFVPASLGFGPIVIFDIIVWFYSFFNVHNLASLPDEEFYAVEDRFLFRLSDFSGNEASFLHNYRKLAAIVLIFSGISMTWRELLSILENLGFLPSALYRYISYVSWHLPKIFAGVDIIILGILMIQGKKKELDRTCFLKEEDDNGKKE